MGEQQIPTLRIAAVDYWPGDGNAFVEALVRQLLKNHYNCVTDPRDPEVIFYDHFANERFRYACPKIFLTAESTIPNFTVADYAMSKTPSSVKNSPYILWNLSDQFLRNQVTPKFAKLHAQPKTKFCNFVYKNDGSYAADGALVGSFGAVLRKKFAETLMHYKRVDCPSRVLNNMPSFDGEKTKVQFVADYKFTIAFENEKVVDYVTEKIYQPFLGGSIPIYWGAPNIADYFNPKAFINCYDYPDFDAVIARVKQIDNDPALYQEYRAQPIVLPDSKLHEQSREKLGSKLVNIIEKLTRPSYKPVYGDSSFQGRLRTMWYTRQHKRMRLERQNMHAKTKTEIATQKFIR